MPPDARQIEVFFLRKIQFACVSFTTIIVPKDVSERSVHDGPARQKNLGTYMEPVFSISRRFSLS